MKTRTSVSKQLFIGASFLLFSALVFTACKKNKDNSMNTTNRTYSISGSASGSQVVPAVSDSGTAMIAGTFSQSSGQLITTTSWSNLTGAPTLGGIYSGAAGSNGSLVGSTFAFSTGLSGTGSFSDTMTLSTAQAAELTTGNYYFLLGTAANPTGEVRGQITATAQ